MRELAVAAALLLLPSAASAQMYEGDACEPSSALSAEALKAGRVASLGNDWIGQFDGWATTWLKPSGKAPELPAEGSAEDPEVFFEAKEARDRWTCMYSAHSAQDGDPKTAWCEGLDGPGVGATLLVKHDSREPALIHAGYGKSAALFAKNARPKRVRVTVWQATRMDVTQGGELYTDLVPRGSREVELKDLNAPQPLPLPEHERGAVATPFSDPSMAPPATFLGIELLEAYPGSTWQDTCISEVAAAPAAKP